MDIDEFLGLIKPFHMHRLVPLLRESGISNSTNDHPKRIIESVKQGLEDSQFSEERVFQYLSLEFLAEALISIAKISDNGSDNTAFNILSQAGILTPSFCPHCKKENHVGLAI